MPLDFVNYGKSLFPESARAGLGVDGESINWSDVGVGIVPIGSVVAWCKSFVFGTSAAALLPNYLECDGSIIADGDSPLDGLTLPNLNAGERFLKGAVTSGTTGGDNDFRGSGFDATGAADSYAIDFAAGNTMPAYYEVVWVMRIK